LATLTLGFVLLPAWADDPESLRKEILKLNDAVGEEFINLHINRLKKGPEQAKPLVALGAKLASEKEPVLNYTGAYILGTVASELKDVEAGKALYQVCIDRAGRIKSDRKLAMAYLASINLHAENKKIDEAEGLALAYLKQEIAPDDIDELTLDGDKDLVALLGRLAKDKETSARLVKAGAALVAKDKQQALNQGAVYLFANLAREIDDFDASKALLKLCLDRCQDLIDRRLAQLQKEGRFQADDLVEGLGKLATLHIEYIDLLFDNKKFDEAEKAAKVVLELPYGNYVAVAKVHALLRGIQATAMLGKVDEAMKQLQPYLKKFPDDPDIMRLHGWLLIQAGKNDEATRAYEQLLTKAGTTEDAKERYRYLLSGLYTETGEVEKAMQHLRVLLQKKPDHPTYNNDLGYMLADHDMNLEEAERLVRKALEKEPTKASFMDSLGWVLYKQKKFKEAKEYLQQAIQNKEGQHAEIFDHLGDVHMALGEKADAISAWKKAVQVSGTTARELKRKTEVEKKVKEHE
jgi:predicted Zn-dependent protease